MGTAVVGQPPGVVVCRTVTLACPKAVQQDPESSWEIEARDASSRIGIEGMICYLEVIPGLPPSRTNPRSRSQAAVATLEILKAGDGQDDRRCR